MPRKPNMQSCFCQAQTLAEEQLLGFENIPLTPIEEKIVNYIRLSK